MHISRTDEELGVLAVVSATAAKARFGSPRILIIVSSKP